MKACNSFKFCSRHYKVTSFFMSIWNFNVRLDMLDGSQVFRLQYIHIMRGINLFGMNKAH